jgi:hypothetical protein
VPGANGSSALLFSLPPVGAGPEVRGVGRRVDDHGADDEVLLLLLLLLQVLDDAGLVRLVDAPVAVGLLAERLPLDGLRNGLDQGDRGSWR